MRDFTLLIYQQLLSALIKCDYKFVTFEQFCEGLRPEKMIILRHDVDLKAENSLAVAKIEASLGLKASYYFRVVAQSNKPEIIKEIASLGHEIGYHYEDMAIVDGDVEKAYAHFIDKLAYFRGFYPVRTICMHGSPAKKFDNKDLWTKYDYKAMDLIGEPYFDLHQLDPEMHYITDTGRMWDGHKYSVRDKMSRNQITNIHSTNDLISAVEMGEFPNKVMITTHPQRWTNNSYSWCVEFLNQSFKNLLKLLLVK